MKKSFMNEYMNQTENEYYWTAKDAKHLKDLQAKITKSLKDKNHEPTAEKMSEAFDLIMKRLPAWYKERGLSVSVINSNYNQIILQIKSDANNRSVRTSKEAKQNVSDKQYVPV